MALTNHRRGDFGAWVSRQRLPLVRKAKWTQGDLAERLNALNSGVSWNRTKVADIERGVRTLDQLTPDERADLQKVLGEFPSFEQEPAPDDLHQLVAAMNRQSEALKLLADAVRDSNQTQQGTVRAQGQIVGLLARILAPQGSPAEKRLLQALAASGLPVET